MMVALLTDEYMRGSASMSPYYSQSYVNMLKCTGNIPLPGTAVKPE